MSSPEDGRSKHTHSKDNPQNLRLTSPRSVLERFRELTGSLNHIPIADFPILISQKTGIPSSLIKGNSYSLFRSLGNKSVQPDLSMFIVDRLQSQSKLKARFGWKNISLHEAVAVLTVLQPETNFITFYKQILQKVLITYPSLSPVLRKEVKRRGHEYSIPTIFFSEPFDQLFPGNEGKNIASLIRKTVEQYKLTPIEYATLLLKASGKESKQISRILEFSNLTVKNHVNYILDKLRQGGLGEDLSNITQATVRLFREDLLPKPVLKTIPKYNYEDLILKLSPTELQVLTEIASGKSNKEIAATRVISWKTVKNHMTSIMAKLGCPNRVVASLVYLLADRDKLFKKDMTSVNGATKRASQEMLNLQTKLNNIFAEVYQILENDYGQGRNKAVVTRLSSSVGKVIAIGMKEFSFGLVRKSSFYRLYSEWSKLQSLATAMGYKVENFEKYCKRYKNIEVRNFLAVALRKHVDAERESGIGISSKTGKQPRHGVLFRG